MLEKQHNLKLITCFPVFTDKFHVITKARAFLWSSVGFKIIIVQTHGFLLENNP